MRENYLMLIWWYRYGKALTEGIKEHANAAARIYTLWPEAKITSRKGQ